MKDNLESIYRTVYTRCAGAPTGRRGCGSHQKTHTDAMANKSIGANGVILVRLDTAKANYGWFESAACANL
jgi:hypothetical protein